MTDSDLHTLLHKLHEADARLHASPWGSPEFDTAAAELEAIRNEIVRAELLGELAAA